MNAKLEVVVGRSRGESYELHRGCDLEFGRDQSCSVQVFDEGVSRRHFRIQSIGNSFLIEDLHSSNGTYVNGQRVRTKILRSSDVIHAGASKLVFEYVAAEHEYARFDPAVQIEDTGTRSQDGTVVLQSEVTRQALDTFIGESATQADQHNTAAQLRTLFSLGHTLADDLDLPSVLNNTLDTILKAVPADRGYIVLVDSEDRERFEQVAIRTPMDIGVITRGRKRRETLSLSRTVLDRVLGEGVAVLSTDAQRDPKLGASDSVLLQGISSVVCVPLLCKARVLGAIYLDRQGCGPKDAYDGQDMQFLTAIGQTAGIGIENARRHEHLERLFYSMVKTLVSTIEAKDVYTHGHSERVTAVSMQIAEAMGFEGRDLDNLRLGALLHDIGKIGVPEKVLRKPARLTDEEFAIMKSHPSQGADIVENIYFLPREVIDVVRHHHEKWNGTGYPSALKGSQIPIFARVVAVADAFDAMTSSRNYRRNFEVKEVIAEYHRCAGDHFDRNIAEVFISLLESGEVLPSFLMYKNVLESSQETARIKAQV